MATAGRDTPTTDDAAEAGPARRALTGAAAAAPVFGGLSGYYTLQLLQRGAGVAPAFTQGLLQGALRAAPFALGGAVFYVREHEARGVAYRFAERDAGAHSWRARLFGHRALPLRPSSRAGDDGDGTAPTQYERMFGPRDPSRDHASAASKMAAGAAAAGLTTTGMFLLRWPGFRSVGTVAGMTAGCAAAAVFMPDYEDVAKRAAIW
jgi:hypothetical protein